MNFIGQYRWVVKWLVKGASGFGGAKMSKIETEDF